MNTIKVNFPVPPVDAVMPAAAQDMMLWSGAILAVICFAIALRMSVKYKTLLPVLFPIAGFCTVVMEPLADVMVHCYHPPVGQITLYMTSNVALPVHTGLIYISYFGAVYLALFSRIVNDSFTSAYLWKAYFVICVLAYLFEIYPVSVGLWLYYEPQALWPGKVSLPLWCVFVNATCVFTSLALIKFLYPLLKGWKQLLVIALSPLGAVMGHLGPDFPISSIYNSSASANPLLVQLSGLLSVALALLLAYICIKIMTCARIACE